MSWSNPLKLVVLVFLLIGCSRGVFGQEPATAANEVKSTDDVYKTLLDLVFPRKLGGRFEIQLVLRYTPTAERESQIVISCQLDGRCDVVLYQVPEGSPPVFIQAQDVMERMGIHDPHEIRKHLKVSTQRLEPLPVLEVRALVYEFAQLRLPPPLDVRLSFDAYSYQCWMRAGMQEMYFSFADSDPQIVKDRHPLVAWMIKTKATVEKLAAESRVDLH